jgi:hypothetical protein
MRQVLNRVGIPFLAAALVFASMAQADTLELRSGKSLDGSYAGGSSNNIRFRSDGSTSTHRVSEVDSLFFADSDAGDPNAKPTTASAADSGGGDSLELRSGKSYKGGYSGGSSSNVRFSSGGTMYTFNVATIEAIFFTSDASAAPAAAPAPAAAAAPAAPAPAAAPAARPMVPAGSRVMVRTSQAIDSKRQQAGFRFTVRLESDLVADGVVVAQRGANAYGVLTQAKQSGRVAGRSQLTLTLTDIMVNDQMRPVVTSDVQAVTDNTAGTSARRTLGAAAIGGLISGKSGAKTGAAVGLGASILTSGETINIPAGTLLEFRLGQPFQG